MQYNIKPFVKWAGGKRQIISEIKKYMPKSYNNYYEPFVGGGALFFELTPKNAVINDYNSELINVYNILRNADKVNELVELLKLYESQHSEEFYYNIRNMDRDKETFNKLTDVGKGARTIYLNKSCFNGLYRVNSKNEFNVPFNKSKKVNTFDESNLLDINTYFSENNIEILCGDFEQAIKNVQAGDFIYFDPPYDTLKNSFTSYTENGFTQDDQKRLFESYKKLDKLGAKVMLSNHNTEFINNLYKDYNIIVIQAKRNINSKGNARGNVEETIITNYI